VVLLILIPLISPNSSKGGVTFYTSLFVYGCGGELLVSFYFKSERNLHMFCQFVSHTEYSGYNEGRIWNLACTFQCVPFLSTAPAVDRFKKNAKYILYFLLNANKVTKVHQLLLLLLSFPLLLCSMLVYE